MSSLLTSVLLYAAGGFITLYLALEIEDVNYEEVKHSEKTFAALYVVWPILAFYVVFWILVKPVATYILNKLGGEKQ